MFCLTSYMFFLNKQKNRVERKEGRRKKNQNEEGCEGQDEVEKDTGGKLVKGIFTLLLSRAKGQTRRQTNKHTANIEAEE